MDPDTEPATDDETMALMQTVLSQESGIPVEELVITSIEKVEE